MDKIGKPSNIAWSILTGAAILAGLSLTRWHDYLLFHSLAELFGIVVAGGVFIIAWNARGIITNGYLLTLGIGLLAVGTLDLVHMLAYQGMPIFRGYDADLPTQLWVASRYLLLGSFLVASLFVTRKASAGWMLAACLAVLAAVLVAIFARAFPACFVAGAGLTPFKKISEYVISGGFLLALIPLIRYRQRFSSAVALLIGASIVVSALSDLLFTLYSRPDGLFNMVGHLAEAASFLLIYKAIVQTGVKDPYRLLFADVERAQRALQQHVRQLQRIEWLLTRSPDRNRPRLMRHTRQIPAAKAVGRELQSLVGQDVLVDITQDYLDLMDSSATVCERDGDYAVRIFTSGWCQFLDEASRKLCGTEDLGEAARCGKWVCHESCWTNTSKLAVETGRPVDKACSGGLRLHAQPIMANGEVVGAISFGYGDPPRDEGMLREVAEKYCVDVEELRRLAEAYESRPPFIVDLAKNRLAVSARLIGTVVEQKRAERELRKARDELELRVEERTVELKKTVDVLEDEVRHRQRVQQDLVESEQRYRQLFEVAPMGIGITTMDGTLLAGNRTLQKLTGYGPHELRGLPAEQLYADGPDGRQLRAAVSQKGQVRDWETILKRKDGSVFPARLNVDRLILAGQDVLLKMLQDISEQKHAEARDDMVRRLLELFALKATRKEYLDAAAELFRRWSGCDAVGVRLVNAEGYVPYEASAGLSEEFRQQESDLCLGHDQCACTRVIANTPEAQDRLSMNLGGSFVCGHLGQFVESLPPEQQCRFRGTCVRAGYQTLAIIPIRYHGQAVGAIQLADRRENVLPAETVEFIESMAVLVGEAVHRFDMEDALRSSEHRIHAIFNQTYQFMALIAPDGAVLEVNQTALDFVGSVLSDIVGQPFWDTPWWTLSQDARRRLKAAVASAAEGKFVRYEEEIAGRDDNVTTVDFSLRPVPSDSGEIGLIIAEARDISERRRLENEILQVAQNEQRRLGQDLHDTLGQNLTGIAFLSRSLRHKLKAREIPEAGDALEIEKLANLTTTQARSLARGLCPVEPRADGLMISLQEIAGNTRTVFGLHCEFKCNRPVLINSDFAAMHFYYIAQEAVNNAIKHGKPQRITISLIDASDKVTLTVKDDGAGLPADWEERNGMGLRTMAFRARAIGGSLEVKGLPKAGTVVSCAVSKQVLADRMELSNGEGR